MSDRRMAGMFFVAALLVRLVCSSGAAIFGTDSGSYLLMADWMREGRFADACAIAYHPGYPFLIAGARTFTGSSESAGEAVSVLLGAGGVVPLFYMVRTVFSRPAAFIAAVIYAFIPWCVVIQSDVMTEGTYMFFTILSMWLTWRAMDKPSLLHGGGLGIAAAGAFLTRPEGLLAMALAMAWPGVELLRVRDQVWKRLATMAVTAVVMVGLLSPYLLWVRGFRGHWALSARPSAISAEQAVGITEIKKGEETSSAERKKLYGIYFKSLFTLSMSGALLPFYALGVTGLKRVGWRKGLFYFSFPLGLLGGTLFALRTHNFMADRYLFAGMALLGGLAGCGVEQAIAWSARRWPTSRWRPAIILGLILIVGVGPGFRCLNVRRRELLSYPVAAQWILDHGPRPRGMSGSASQVAYLCGCRHYYSWGTAKDMEEIHHQAPFEYVAYSEKDLESHSEWVANLRSWNRVGPAIEIKGPPGSLKVYLHRIN